MSPYTHVGQKKNKGGEKAEILNLRVGVESVILQETYKVKKKFRKTGFAK